MDDQQPHKELTRVTPHGQIRANLQAAPNSRKIGDQRPMPPDLDLFSMMNYPPLSTILDKAVGRTIADGPKWDCWNPTDTPRPLANLLVGLFQWTLSGRISLVLAGSTAWRACYVSCPVDGPPAIRARPSSPLSCIGAIARCTNLAARRASAAMYDSIFWRTGSRDDQASSWGSLGRVAP